MAIRLTCPRCKAALLIPNDQAGQYAKCANCQGRMWVAADAPRDGASLAAVTAVAGSVPAPPTQKPTAGRGHSQPPPPFPLTSRATPGTAPPPLQPPGAGGPPPGPAPVPPAPPGPQRKTARFISPEAANSTLQVAEDGKLPELSLRETGRKEKPRSDSTTVNPLVLFLVLATSIVTSVFLVMTDVSPVDESAARQKIRARQAIEENFLPPPGDAEPELYETLLREALLEHSRRNYQQERRLYRRVLSLLRAELPDQHDGVTGSRYRDQELEEWLTVLLREE